MDRVIEVMDRPARLLLVEDNEGDVLLTREAFRRSGLRNRLAVARDGAEAAAQLRAGPGGWPDVILMDLNLPDVTGVDLLRAIRAEPRLGRIAVLTLSGAAPEAAAPPGAQGVLAKPLDVKSLIAALRPLPHFRVVERGPDPAAPSELAHAR